MERLGVELGAQLAQGIIAAGAVAVAVVFFNFLARLFRKRLPIATFHALNAFFLLMAVLVAFTNDGWVLSLGFLALLGYRYGAYRLKHRPEPKAGLDSPKHRKLAEVSFDYPANWRVDEAVELKPGWAIIVESRGRGSSLLIATTSAEVVAKMSAAFPAELRKLNPTVRQQGTAAVLRLLGNEELVGTRTTYDAADITFFSYRDRRTQYLADWYVMALGAQTVHVFLSASLPDWHRADEAFTLILSSLQPR